jgi:hypothetical protein
MGISAGQVGTQLQTFHLRKQESKEKGEDYMINVRFNYEDRYNLRF